MTDREQTCCFTGHRSSKLPWGSNEKDPRCLRLKAEISSAISELCRLGVRHFICGMALGCDTYFAEAVIALRVDHPDITLEAAIRFDGQDKGWNAENSARYGRILSSCDKVTLVSHDYSPGCMQRRNEYMVDNSAHIIAVFDGSAGGTLNTLRYAVRSGIDIHEIEP